MSTNITFKGNAIFFFFREAQTHSKALLFLYRGARGARWFVALFSSHEAPRFVFCAKEISSRARDRGNR